MDNLINNIKNVMNDHISVYIKVPIESIKRVHDLLINNIIYNPLNCSDMNYFGWFYKHIKKDYNLIKKYYKQNLFLFV